MCCYQPPHTHRPSVCNHRFVTSLSVRTCALCASTTDRSVQIDRFVLQANPFQRTSKWTRRTGTRWRRSWTTSQPPTPSSPTTSRLLHVCWLLEASHRCWFSNRDMFYDGFTRHSWPSRESLRSFSTSLHRTLFFRNFWVSIQKKNLCNSFGGLAILCINRRQVKVRSFSKVWLFFHVREVTSLSEPHSSPIHPIPPLTS